MRLFGNYTQVKFDFTKNKTIRDDLRMFEKIKKAKAKGLRVTIITGL